MMRRSFAEIDSAQSQSRRKKELSILEGEFASIGGLNNCSKCLPSIAEYYLKCSQIRELSQKMQVYTYITLLNDMSIPSMKIIISPQCYLSY